jgi:hypothetical protein
MSGHGFLLRDELARILTQIPDSLQIDNVRSPFAAQREITAIAKGGLWRRHHHGWKAFFVRIQDNKS